MSATEPQTINAASGDTVATLVTVKDRLAAIVDLTGFTAKFVLSRNGVTVVDSEAAEATITWPDRVNGQVQATIAPAVSEPLVGTYDFELQLTRTSDGAKGRAAFGYVNLAENLIAA